MAITPFAPTSWSDDESLDPNKLNRMASNDQWLFENTPRMVYKAYGITRPEGLKIAAGNVIFPAFTSAVDRTLEFGTFFSPACNPVVTVGVQSSFGALWPIVRGIGGGIVDHRGFVMRVYTFPNGKMTSAFRVNWIAVGF